MAKRKQRHEEHPDERWLITYADVLTLMFVLFMVLFSISVVNTAKFDMLKQTLQDAFNSGLAAGGTSVLETNPGTPAPAVTTQAGQIAPEVPTIQGLSVTDASPEQVLESSAARGGPEGDRVNARRRRGRRQGLHLRQRAGPLHPPRDRRRAVHARLRVPPVGGREDHRADRPVPEGAPQPGARRGPHRLHPDLHRGVPVQLGAVGRPGVGGGPQHASRRASPPAASRPPASPTPSPSATTAAPRAAR